MRVLIVVFCLLTGFVFISALGVLQTAFAAALLNLFVGVSAIRIYQDSGGGNRLWISLPKLSLPTFSFDSDQKVWMGVSLVCGFTALAYEVVWTRLLVFSISSTVYSFSMMLAVFLLGIVIGSVLVIPVISRRWRACAGRRAGRQMDQPDAPRNRQGRAGQL